jgi:hypothetical protein
MLTHCVPLQMPSSFSLRTLPPSLISIVGSWMLTQHKDSPLPMELTPSELVRGAVGSAFLKSWEADPTHSSAPFLHNITPASSVSLQRPSEKTAQSSTAMMDLTLLVRESQKAPFDRPSMLWLQPSGQTNCCRPSMSPQAGFYSFWEDN